MQMMRHLLATLVAALFMLPAHAQDQSYADCVAKATSSWGQPCDKCEIYTGYKRDYRSVYQLELRNICGEMLEVKVAVEEQNGTWRTFPVRTLASGDTLTAFACRGTGRYLYWARRVNDTEIVLPTDGEIVSAYPGN